MSLQNVGEQGPKSQAFIQDVINFIDQPLSPQSLHKLKKSCKSQGLGAAADANNANNALSHQLEAHSTQQPVAASPTAEEILGGQYDSLAILFPVGSEIEAQHLTTATEFNGLRGKVAGHQDGKVLVLFHGGSGQVFDIPSYNLRVVTQQPTATASPVPVAPAVVAPVAPLAPAVLPAPLTGTYGNYTGGLLSASTLSESISLQAKLKCAMSHVESAHEAMRVATQLHILDAEGLYNVVSEFQPTLSRANVAKNWAKIVQIYQAHAERVGAGQAPEAPAAAASQPAYSPAQGSYATAPAEGELTSNLQGVINFIDAPLSPNTLKEVRTIRHSLSPRRAGRSASPNN